MSAEETVLEMVSEHVLTGLCTGLCSGLSAGLGAGSEGNPVVEGLSAAEVRWILPGRLDAALLGWFARFPAGMSSCEDAYLIQPLLRGLAVKIGAGRMFEVKLYDGSPGILDTAGRARGRIEAWRRWSYPIGPLGPDDAGPPGWAVVYKRRWGVRFQLVGGRLMADVPEQVTEPACTAELTEVRMDGEAWWSLSFVATGPAALRASTLEGTAALMFAEKLPGDVKLDMSHGQSYIEWLSRHRVPAMTERDLRVGASASS